MSAERPNPANQDHVAPPERHSGAEKKDRFLILTRKVDQAIVYLDAQGRRIAYVVVLRVDRDRVKIGSRAGSDITILREELLGKTRQPNK